jgi:hypothetical protein
VTRERVCRLQLLLALASTLILGSESLGVHDHILLSQIRDSPKLEGQVPVFISPRNRVAQLYSQALGSLFVASYDSQGYSGGIRTRLHAGATAAESESYVTTDGQPASLSWNKAPIWGLRPDLHYCQTVAGLLMWGALVDKRTSLPFTIATGPRQRSHSATTFCCLRFETSLEVASYDSQGYGGGARP